MNNVLDNGFDARLIELATSLQDDYLDLKHRLVQERKNRFPRERIDDFLAYIGWDRDRLAAFEEYDYDPMASEIRQYALAVGMSISTTCSVYGESLTATSQESESIFQNKQINLQSLEPVQLNISYGKVERP